METRKFKIVSETGIHARPATLLVQTATKYDSKIMLTYDHKSVNLKSIMGVMSLGVGQGALITVSADGKDEKSAIKDVTKAMKKEGLSD